MPEMSSQQISQFELPNHGEVGHMGVIGRSDVVQHEQGLINEWQGVTAAEMNREDFEKKMAYVRQDMRAFTDDADLNQKVDTYFSDFDGMPEMFKAGKAQAEEVAQQPLSWSGWLAEAASDEQVLNFLQWHNHTHEQRQGSPEFQAEVAQKKAEFMQKVQNLQAAGGLHEDTLGIAQKLGEVKVSLSDIFNSYIWGQEGFSHTDTNEVEVVEGGGSDILWHELKHKTIERPDDSENDTWAREAVAEHTAQVMHTGGDIEQFNPSDEQARYKLDRMLMARVMEGIPAVLVTRYYSALTETSMAETKAVLEQAFVTKYGVPDVIDCIGSYIAERSASDENTVYAAGVELEIDLEKRDAVLTELIQNPSKAFNKQESTGGHDEKPVAAQAPAGPQGTITDQDVAAKAKWIEHIRDETGKEIDEASSIGDLPGIQSREDEISGVVQQQATVDRARKFSGR